LDWNRLNLDVREELNILIKIGGKNMPELFSMIPQSIKQTFSIFGG